MKIQLSKTQWEHIGKQAGWEPKIVPKESMRYEGESDEQYLKRLQDSLKYWLDLQRKYILTYDEAKKKADAALSKIRESERNVKEILDEFEKLPK